MVADPAQAEVIPVTHPDRQFQEFLRQGRFMLQRSAGTGKHVFYPRVVAPGSGANDLHWVPASGRGIVYSVTVVRPKPPQAPYNVALVELEEGPRLMTRIDEVAIESIRIGMAVEARIAQPEQDPYVVFVPSA